MTVVRLPHRTRGHPTPTAPAARSGRPWDHRTPLGRRREFHPGESSQREAPHSRRGVPSVFQSFR